MLPRSLYWKMLTKVSVWCIYSLGQKCWQMLLKWLRIVIWSENDIYPPLSENEIFSPSCDTWLFCLLLCPFCLNSSLFCIYPFTSHFLFYFSLSSFSFPFHNFSSTFCICFSSLSYIFSPNDISWYSPRGIFQNIESWMTMEPSERLEGKGRKNLLQCCTYIHQKVLKDLRWKDKVPLHRNNGCQCDKSCWTVDSFPVYCWAWESLRSPQFSKTIGSLPPSEGSVPKW